MDRYHRREAWKLHPEDKCEPQLPGSRVGLLQQRRALRPPVHGPVRLHVGVSSFSVLTIGAWEKNMETPNVIKAKDTTRTAFFAMQPLHTETIITWKS